MNDKCVHDVSRYVAAGHLDTGERLETAAPGYGQQVAIARRLNVALDGLRLLRVSLDPDTWAALVEDRFIGKPFEEPGALLA